MADKSKKRSKTKEIKELKEKTKAILESDSNANFIVDILELSESRDEALLVAFVRAAHKIFTTFLSRGKLHRNLNNYYTKSSNTNFEEKEDEKEEGSDDPQDIFHHWLREKYLVIIRRLLHFLHEDSQNIKEFALCTLMKFVEVEGKNDRQFPNDLFRQICDALLDKRHNMKICIERFAEYLEYDDVRFFVLKNLAKSLDAAPTSCGQYLVGNAFAMLNQLKVKEKDEDLANFLVKQCKIKAPESSGNEMKPSFCVLRQHKRVFSSAWLAFLALPLTSEIHKKVLLSFHSDVIPHMMDPKLLMDFLTDSYNIGGATSLLALNSLFILIHQHNLDYPEFFKKLYALFEPSVFHVKYRARFFYLADMFLMSTHLPAYLVAAFAKRLSHLSLSAPPSGIMLIVPFVCNLIKRHPSIQVLIHRKKKGNLLLNGDEHSADVNEGDPFIPDEPDPAKSNALQSSLWELKTVHAHFYPGASSLVDLLEKPIDAAEIDITKYLDVDWDDLFQEECRDVRDENAHMEFQLPQGILSKGMSESWVLE